jgi:hypothetical protein
VRVSSGTDRKQLTAAVDRARRRVAANQTLREGALAAAIALTGPTLLLVAGWEWFAWPLAAAFPVAGVVVGVWRLWRCRPHPYRVAQALDARLATEDQISTAIHFLEKDGAAVMEQRRAAAGVAARSDPEAAFPFAMPRSAYALAAVFVLATALFALRYLIEKPLELRRPLPAIVLRALRGEDPAEQQRLAKQAAEKALAREQGLALEGQDPNAQNRTERGAASGENAEQESDKGQAEQPSGDGVASSEELGDQMALNGDNDPIQSYEDMLERDARSGLAKAQGKDGKEREGNGEKEGRSADQDSNSLLERLREAMKNMLSKLQQKAPGSGQQQMAQAGAQSQGAEQQPGNGQGEGSAQSQNGAQDGNGADSGENGADGAQANAQGKEGGKNSDGGTRGDSGQGAGNQEGDKQLKEMLQAEAMGKLTELYGRRAASVTGEVTVEAQPGKQTLRTPLAQTQARHLDSGGEVSRDQIPLAYQAYVKEYFQKIRQAPKK